MHKARSRVAAIAFACLIIVAPAATSASALVGNPPGNNGTVKVNGIDIQSIANQPHVGCSFSIAWFGFDANAVSTVTFETQAPTSKRLLITDVVALSSEGSGSRLYSLSFDPVLDKFQPNQGFHVSLTVNTTGSIGADVKHKEFWVQSCGEGSPPPAV